MPKPKSIAAESFKARIAQDAMVPSPTHQPAMTPGDVIELRQLFWSNVVRDMLMGLSALQEKQPELFDGRSAILTHQGERIAIAQLQPVFAVSVPKDGSQHDASIAVQCTVFRVQTPGGEVFTLPIQEIRGLHMLTPELVNKLQQLEADEEDDSHPGKSEHPFGFAAFAALPKKEPAPPPEHPTE